MENLVDVGRLPKSARRLHKCLLAYRRRFGEGKVYPSQKRLAENLKMPLRTVKFATAKLKAAGIWDVYRPIHNRTRHLTNRYNFTERFALLNRPNPFPKAKRRPFIPLSRRGPIYSSPSGNCPSRLVKPIETKTKINSKTNQNQKIPPNPHGGAVGASFPPPKLQKPNGQGKGIPQNLKASWEWEKPNPETPWLILNRRNGRFVRTRHLGLNKRACPDYYRPKKEPRFRVPVKSAAEERAESTAERAIRAQEAAEFFRQLREHLGTISPFAKPAPTPNTAPRYAVGQAWADEQEAKRKRAAESQQAAGGIRALFPGGFINSRPGQEQERAGLGSLPDSPK